MASGVAPSLGPEQIASFGSNGFLAISAITTAEEVAWLRGAYDELIADERALRLRYDTSATGGPSGIIDQIFLPERQCPKLLETTYLANAELMAALLLCAHAAHVPYGGARAD